ncbi:arylesterase [Caulobacter flavus]|uniref:Arylesterase n=1 Tax=Caulobacter flavus TaxID=1679497 RepID=A0A2N5CV40_9CAUL|nr:alpha/beta hydrolase [Caulobacter flavus]AYV45441.1 arylesterase [Caulobacter flavus]PLR17673.1 arylesterase [Caulobacter flavus]
MSRTILMIHGYGMTGDSWDPVADTFRKAGYAVETPTIRPALRTAGPPSPDLAGLSLADYVAELSAAAAVTAARDGVKPIVFGHSMGGLIAQKLAESGLTSGIVLFAPASPADARGKPKLSPMITFLNAVLSQGGAPKPVKMWKTGFKFGVVNAVPAARHDALYAKAVYDSGRVLQDLAYPDRDPSRTVHVDAAKVTVPVLVLAGARDRTTPVEDVRLVGRKYAGADYREYPDHAHWLIDEPGSDALLGAVQSWLSEKGLGPASAAPPKAKAEPAPAAAAPEPAAAAPATEASAAPAPKPRAPAKAKTPSKAKAVVAEPAAQPAAKPKTAPKAPAKAPTKASAKAKAAPAVETPAAAAVAKPAKPPAKAAATKAAPKAKAAAVKPEKAPKPAAKAEAAPKTAAPAKPDKAPAKPKAAAAPAADAAKPAPRAAKAAPEASAKVAAPAKPAASKMRNNANPDLMKATETPPKPAKATTKAPAKAAAKPQPKPKAATTTPAKTSPRGKKSV